MLAGGSRRTTCGSGVRDDIKQYACNGQTQKINLLCLERTHFLRGCGRLAERATVPQYPGRRVLEVLLQGLQSKCKNATDEQWGSRSDSDYACPCWCVCVRARRCWCGVLRTSACKLLARASCWCTKSACTRSAAKSAKQRAFGDWGLWRVLGDFDGL